MIPMHKVRSIEKEMTTETMYAYVQKNNGDGSKTIAVLSKEVTGNRT